MKTYHILNGDCLAEIFPINLKGEKIIWRECLVEGNLDEEHFFENRKRYISKSLGAEVHDYEEKVIGEYHKILNLKPESKVYFWFEHDLFCQVNFWFLLSKFSEDFQNLFIVYPCSKDFEGFGNHDSEDLLNDFQNATPIHSKEINLAKKLWKAFKENDFQELEKLSKTKTEVFPNLKELIEAQENRNNGKLINEIKKLKSQSENPKELFKLFTKKFGIYGFGDLQFYSILKET